MVYSAVIVEFNPAQLPRSMNREQWKDAYRWARILDKRLREWADENRKAFQTQFQDLLAYGTARTAIDENNKLINLPPFEDEE